MTTTYGTSDTGGRARPALAHPRHRRRGRHRRRLRRRLRRGGRALDGALAPRPAPEPPLRRLAAAGDRRSAHHPQARRGALRRGRRRRPVGVPRQHLGRRHAPVRGRAGSGRRARLRSHALPLVQLPRPGRGRPGRVGRGVRPRRRTSGTAGYATDVLRDHGGVDGHLRARSSCRSRRSRSSAPSGRPASSTGSRPDTRHRPVRSGRDPAGGFGFTYAGLGRARAPGRRPGRPGRRLPARGRAVGLGQEHARPGPGRARPARVAGHLAGLADRRRRRDPGVRPGRARREGRPRLPGPVPPDRHGPGRGRRRVRAREPGLAASDDARAGPGGARGRRARWHGARRWPERSRAASSSDSRWRASWRRCRACSSSTSRPPTSTRPVRPPSSSASHPIRAERSADDRPRRASRRRGVAARRHRSGPRRHRSPDRRRDRRSEVLTEHGRRLSDAGIWLPGDRLALASRPRVGAPAQPPAAPDEPLLRASGITFGYDRATPVVVDVNLDVGAGERIALVGPNGSGKSTRRAAPGRAAHARIADPSDSAERTQRVCPPTVLARWGGYVFQEPERQFLTQTVRDEVLLGLRPGRGRACRRTDGAVRSAARDVRRAQPVPIVGRGAATAVAGSGPGAPSAGARPRRADVRPGSAWLRGPAGDPATSGSRRGPASSCRPTTSASSRTWRRASSGSISGRVVSDEVVS